MRTPLSILLLLAAASPAAGQNTVDDFEALIPLGGTYQYIGASLDENTVAGPYGPGLVVDGCTYSDPAGIGLYYYGFWGGQVDGSVGVSTNGGPAELRMDYDAPVDFVEVVVSVGNGWPDTADVTAYDAGGAVLANQTGIVLVDPQNPVTVTLTQPGIAYVTVVSSGAYNWGPYVNSHEYGTSGPALAATGTSGGVMTFDLSGFPAGGSIAIVYGPAGSLTGNAPCGPVTVDLLPLNFPPPSQLVLLTADASGAAQYVQSVPAAAFGLRVQAVDLTGCAVTNFVTIG
jgi:hypothetical protein